MASDLKYLGGKNPMAERQKLELTWIGKDQEVKLEPRILLEDAEKSYGDKNTGNILIHGDNLLALKALEQDFSGRIKCIYIDPPYNTGSAFKHYDDGLEHSIWLSLMKPRMEMLRTLLTEDGSVWISLDDNECHYFKVMMDEIFGRKNFVTTIIWQKIYTVKNSARHFSDMHDYILVYAKNADVWNRNLLPRSKELDASYTNPDNDQRGPWTTNAIQARNYYSLGTYEIVSPAGKIFTPPKGTYWRVSEDTFMGLEKDKRIWWGKDGASVPRIKKFLSEVKQGVVPATFWPHTECGQNAEAKTELRKLLDGILEDELFLTPKPERLIKRVLEIATNPNDYVLDSFLGSGTTAGVAHKMKRNWIGIELGEHCFTHCIPRLQKVIEGTDQGGISKSVNWHGGGGFKFYELAPSLLKKDKYNNWVIDERYYPDMLAAAMAKQEGFRYSPDQNIYWKQGQSTESDYIFTTTTFITVEYLDKIYEDMLPGESLLICCRAFQDSCSERYINITIKKIPGTLLGKCEFGRDDYSLNVVGVSQNISDDGEMKAE